MQEIADIIQKNKFVWGEPIRWHQIDPYTILEFHPWKINGCTLLEDCPSETVSFHGWVDGKDAHESWPTLETCLAGLMGLKYAGNNNGGVGYYFCRMIGAPPYNDTISGERIREEIERGKLCTQIKS